MTGDFEKRFMTVSRGRLVGSIEELGNDAENWIQRLESEVDTEKRRILFKNLKWLNLSRGSELPESLRTRILSCLEANKPGPARTKILHRLAEHIRVDHHITKSSSDNQALRYKTAIEKYPDLAELHTVKMTLAAYVFREEQLHEYLQAHTTELADARSNIQLGGYKPVTMPEDLPAVRFEKECIVCHEYKKGIELCPGCWQNIRKCLELKARCHREGWEGWGYEMSLDLTQLKKLLAEEAASK